MFLLIKYVIRTWRRRKATRQADGLAMFWLLSYLLRKWRERGARPLGISAGASPGVRARSRHKRRGEPRSEPGRRSVRGPHPRPRGARAPRGSWIPRSCARRRAAARRHGRAARAPSAVRPPHELAEPPRPVLHVLLSDRPAGRVHRRLRPRPHGSWTASASICLASTSPASWRCDRRRLYASLVISARGCARPACSSAAAPRPVSPGVLVAGQAISTVVIALVMRTILLVIAKSSTAWTCRRPGWPRWRSPSWSEHSRSRASATRYRSSSARPSTPPSRSSRPRCFRCGSSPACSSRPQP